MSTSNHPCALLTWIIVRATVHVSRSLHECINSCIFLTVNFYTLLAVLRVRVYVILLLSFYVNEYISLVLLFFFLWNQKINCRIIILKSCNHLSSDNIHLHHRTLRNLLSSVKFFVNNSLKAASSVSRPRQYWGEWLHVALVSPSSSRWERRTSDTQNNEHKGQNFRNMNRTYQNRRF